MESARLSASTAVNREKSGINVSLNKYGTCTFKFADGGTYMGEYCKTEDNGLYRHGMGKESKKNGSVYEGKFNMDVMEGEFKIVFADGASFHGGIKDNVFSGNSTYVFPTGEILTCPFKNGIATGDGIFVDKKKMVWNGHFQSNHAFGMRFEYNKNVDAESTARMSINESII
ncbi:hypothetical protein SNEBB_006686 [Seison nebaliae]|nr:hypothetical protein SNEBB_006686 [Seison nebaliae]